MGPKCDLTEIVDLHVCSMNLKTREKVIPTADRLLLVKVVVVVDWVVADGWTEAQINLQCPFYPIYFHGL